MAKSKPQPIETKDVFKGLAQQLRSQARTPNILAYKPHQKQEDFHSSNAKIRLFIGGNRSGKTVAGAVEILWYALGKHPFRQTVPPPVRLRAISVDFLNGVEKIVRPEIARWVPNSELRGGSWSTAYDKLLRTLYFENGSFIEFMSYDQDLDKFAGTSRHGIWFDEEPPSDIWTENQMRLLDVNGDAWITMTPVEGLTWIYDDIFTKADIDPNIKVVEVHQGENPHIEQATREAFLAGLSDDERKAREEGKFVQMGGLIYKNFRGRNIIEPFAPPRDWLWVESMDHGFNNPTAWLWAAVNRDGEIYIFDEHYESGKIIEYHAEVVLKKEADWKRPPDYRVGDPSIRNRDPITGTSVHLEYMEAGVPIVLGNNDVIAGINRVARYIEGKNFDPENINANRPRLFITKNCVNLLWELKKYHWAKWASKKIETNRNKKEEPTKKDDHACDAMRYLVASRPEVEDFSIPEYNFAPPEFTHAVSPKGRVDPAFLPQKHTRYRYIDETLGGEW